MIYGDLDVSVLDELPPGRQKIDTFWIDSKKRGRAYGFLQKHLNQGLQGYIVCPLVENESGEASLASAGRICREPGRPGNSGIIGSACSMGG